MKNKLFALFLILVVAVFVTPENTKVYAATASHANQANSSSGNTLNSRLKVESTMTAHGNPMKITLYLCKTNNVPRDAKGNVLAPKDIGIDEFVKFGKSIILGTDSDVGYSGAYVNIDTCKLDQLSKQIAPAYTSKSINSIGRVITKLGKTNIPAWGDSNCNAANQTAIKNYFICAEDEKLSNLNGLINAVAEKSSGKTGMDAINSTLSKIKQTDFNYVDSNRQKINLTYKNISTLYGEKYYVANWLIVMEPMFTYRQDPYGYFGSKTKVATMTATDAILANKAAGLTGVAFKYKFGVDSPAYNAIVRYCDKCDTTWFAFAKSGTPSIATYCPLPCPSVGPYSEKSGNRYPFSIVSAIRATAKAWQLSDTWLDGYAKANALGSKPSENEILAYGGYSIYFLGPKVQPKPTPTPSITPSPTPTPTPVPVTAAGNVIAENELMKAMQSDAASGGNVSRVSVENTSVDTICPGTKQESYSYYVDVKDAKGNVTSQPRTGTRTVNCGHPQDLAHAKGITSKSLTVQPQWYWNESMFAGLSKLAILRNSGTLKNDGITFAFSNNNASFTSSNMSDAFSAELGGYKFLAHRNSENGEKPLQLAAYMNNTQQNKAFQSFITPYYGGVYPSAFSLPNGNFGGKDINIITSSVLPSVNAIGSGSFCSGGSSNLSIPSKLTGTIVLGKTTVEDNKFRTLTNVTIEPTISEKSRSSKTLATQSVYYNTGLNMAFITRFQSQQISFYPAFKMTYDTNNQGTNSAEVWMLANGERKFMSYDTFSCEVLDSKIEVDAPFSRDREDRFINPNAAQPVARTTPTLKSGSAIKTDASGTTLRITVNVHLQDPVFTDHPAAVQAANDAVIDGYDTKVKGIIAKIKNGGVSYYSNLLQATTKDTLNYIPASDKVVDLSAKTTLRLAEPANVNVNTSIYNQASYLDNNDTADFDPTGKRTITIKGSALPLKRWEDNNVIKSNAILTDLLVENGGDKVAGWYSESYEGVVCITRTYLLEIQNVSSTYAQVHPALSDSLTPRNQLAHELKFSADKTVTLLEEGQFGIGLEIRFPQITLGGVTHTPVLCDSPYLFDIRGSVYDTAAN